MKRFVGSVAVALACAFAVATHAQVAQGPDQTTKTKTEIKGDVKTVTYTGCLETGTETKTFVLNKVVPVTTTRTTEVAGTAGSVTTTSTSYMLVPGPTVELQTHIGKKVEVTGIVIPGGKVESTTKIEREDAPDAKIKSKSENLPQFRVVSIKELSEPCTP